MMDMSRMLAMPCSQKRVSAAAAGALTAYMGFDRILPFPPAVHYAAAGAGVHLACTNGDITGTQEIAICAGLGYAGAYALAMLR